MKQVGQNYRSGELVVLDVPPAHLDELVTGLDALGLSVAPSPFRRHTMACTGIEFCKLAIVETKAAAATAIAELEQRLADVGAEHPQLAGKQGEPLAGLVGVSRLAGVVQRVVETRDLGGVDAVGDRDQVVVDGRRHARPATPARELAGSVAEQLEVGDRAQRAPDAPAPRPGRSARWRGTHRAQRAAPRHRHQQRRRRGRGTAPASPRAQAARRRRWRGNRAGRLNRPDRNQDKAVRFGAPPFSLLSEPPPEAGRSHAPGR